MDKVTQIAVYAATNTGFVVNCYKTYLHRQPSDGEIFGGLMHLINGCSRQQYEYNFMLSPEYQRLNGVKAR